MILKNEINDPIIREAIKRVMAIVQTDRFYQEISEADFFGINSLLPGHYGNQLSIWIADDLKHSFSLDFTFTIKPIKPVNPWSKMVATTFENDPNSLYINIRKSFSIHERVNTISHEISHLFNYGHIGNSSTQFNLSSVPYKVGEIAEKLSREIYGN